MTDLQQSRQTLKMNGCYIFYCFIDTNDFLNAVLLIFVLVTYCYTFYVFYFQLSYILVLFFL